MPEGHSIHRAALDQQAMLVGRGLSVSSPQGRFSEGAGVLDGHICEGIEAYGKHLVYRFSNRRFLHIHLGLAGRIKRSPQPADEPSDVVRIRMESDSHVVDIRGPAICELLDPESLARFLTRIGPDVLRPDADREKVFQRIHKSRSSIGRLLMDQTVISGIGNIYRSEILWRLGIHPDTLGKDIDYGVFTKLWEESRALMEIGLRYNAIITNGEIPQGDPPYRTQVNIYGKSQCPSCNSAIRTYKLAGRAVHVCELCQPKRI